MKHLMIVSVRCSQLVCKCLYEKNIGLCVPVGTENTAGCTCARRLYTIVSRACTRN